MAKTASKEKKERDQGGWQAQKSAMMRDTILDAALDCFVTIGYASTTTARIAEKAKAAGVETVAFDRSGFRYHGRVKALADAAREAGLKF